MSCSVDIEYISKYDCRIGNIVSSVDVNKLTTDLHQCILIRNVKSLPLLAVLKEATNIEISTIVAVIFSYLLIHRDFQCEKSTSVTLKRVRYSV